VTSVWFVGAGKFPEVMKSISAVRAGPGTANVKLSTHVLIDVMCNTYIKKSHGHHHGALRGPILVLAATQSWKLQSEYWISLWISRRKPTRQACIPYLRSKSEVTRSREDWTGTGLLELPWNGHPPHRACE